MRHAIHRRPRILVTRQWPETVLLALAERYDIVVDPLDRPLSSGDLARGMRDFVAICTTITDRLDKQIISQMERRAGLIANLLELENVVLLPHLGSATVETRTAMGLRVLANVDAYFSQQVPPDRVV